jgi:hypothetical protein
MMIFPIVVLLGWLGYDCEDTAGVEKVAVADRPDCRSAGV